MIDLHLHVLPGVDDGPADLEEALRMCALAAADGCRALIVTPHQRHDLWDNRDRRPLEAALKRLRRAVDEHPDFTLDLHLGAEIRVDSELLHELEEESGPLPLAGSRYLLLEGSPEGVRPDPVALTHELVVDGWIPIFAHPEFVPGLEDPGLASELTALGACYQITATSLLGEFGRRPLEICCNLLDRGLVHFVASDAHGSAWRPPGLSRARERLARRWGEEVADDLTRRNGEAVLADRPLPRHTEGTWPATTEEPESPGGDGDAAVGMTGVPAVPVGGRS